MEFERVEMSKSERHMYEANLKLIEDKDQLLKDIYILIRYINGEHSLISYVNEILDYYGKEPVKYK